MQTAPSETAAVLIEPVLGEGGYVPLPDGFLRSVHKLCKANNILLIADEVGNWLGCRRQPSSLLPPPLLLASHTLLPLPTFPYLPSTSLPPGGRGGGRRGAAEPVPVPYIHVGPPFRLPLRGFL